MAQFFSTQKPINHPVFILFKPLSFFVVVSKKDNTLVGHFGQRLHPVFPFLMCFLCLCLFFLIVSKKDNQDVGWPLWSEDTPRVYFVQAFVILCCCFKKRQYIGWPLWSEATPSVYFVLCVVPLTKIGSIHPEFAQRWHIFTNVAPFNEISH